MPPSARIATPFFAAMRRANVERRHLRNAHARHDARGANRARALPDLDRVRAAIGQIFHPRRTGHIAGDDGQFGECVAQHLHRVAHAFAVAVRGGNGHGIHAAFHESADVREDAFAIQFAEGIARGADRRAAHEAELRIARGFELRLALLLDALDVVHREQAAQIVVVIHHEQFVDAGALGKKLVGAGDGILAEFLLVDGVNLFARRHGLGNLALGVTRFDDVAGEQADEFAFFVHHRKRAEAEFAFLHQLHHVARRVGPARP